jgi:hypothetical protein
MTDLTAQLYDAWKQAVLVDKIVTLFETAQDDPNGRWAVGEQILFGVRWVEGATAYYAENLSRSQAIPGAVEEKPVGGFICQFNGYRALRPGGGHRPLGRQAGISAEPAQCRFYCQDRTHALSLLNREPLLQVQLPHFTWNAYYNVAPLEKNGHFLWVPVDATAARLFHAPQVLTLDFLEDAIALSQRLDDTIIFFNALHAGASVNHIHVQSIYQSQPLPIEAAPIAPYRQHPLLADYPAQGWAFARNAPVEPLFDCIERLQTAAIPLNLILLGNRRVLVARNPEHEIVSEFPGGVLAALDLCGKIITVDHQAYAQATPASLSRAFLKTVLPARTLIASW